MLTKVDKLYWDICTRAKCFLKNLKEEEKGASEMVAIVLLILIVIAVAAVFREQISDVVNSVFENLTDWVDKNKTP